jgi:prophage regulatory protein
MTKELGKSAQPAFFNIQKITEIIGKKKSTIYNWLKDTSNQYDPTFPKPIKFGKNNSGWLPAEIDTWIKSQIESSRPLAHEPLPTVVPSETPSVVPTIVTNSGKSENAIELRTAVVRQYLEGQIKDGVTNVSYEEAMGAIRLWADVPEDREIMEEILESISRTSHADNGVLLGVHIHERHAGVSRPSDRFFDLAKSLGYPIDNPVEFIKDQTLRLFNFYEDPTKKSKGRIVWMQIRGKNGKTMIYRM